MRKGIWICKQIAKFLKYSKQLHPTHCLLKSVGVTWEWNCKYLWIDDSSQQNHSTGTVHAGDYKLGKKVGLLGNKK